MTPNPSLTRSATRADTPSMIIEPLSLLDEIYPVLNRCDLPVSDISTSSPPRFFGFRDAGAVVATIGLEHFHAVGLVRSLAVVPGYRGQGLAKELVAYVESHATSLGVESLYLLTTTAEAFFMKLGYRPALREEAPAAIQASSQFSSVCPASAAFLSKRLEADPGAAAK